MTQVDEKRTKKLWNKAKDKNIWHDLTWLDLKHQQQKNMN